MNILIDIGNTAAKISLAEADVIFESVREDPLKLSTLQTILANEDIENGILSSVTDVDKDVLKFLEARLAYFIILNSATKIPLENLYHSPQTLGNDRISAAVGANKLYPDTELLVIDFGTAITIDHVNSRNQYSGGNISPGLKTRFKALHTFTGKLPLLDKSEKNEWMGKNTEEAVVSGVQNGIVYEIEGYIDGFKNKYKDGHILFTGGDALFFEKKIRSDILVEPKLVFIGLNRILGYNVK